MTQIELGHSIIDEVDLASMPNRIMFRWLDIESNGSINIKYIANEPPFTMDINDFIKTVKDYPEKTEAQILSFADSPLDVRCTEDCWMVFYLDGAWNWQFSSKEGLNSGFSTKKPFGGKYSNLVHVMKGGVEIKGKLDRDGCRLLYLRSKCLNADFKDGFNLHVDLVLRNNKSTTLIIDPMIRNP